MFRFFVALWLAKLAMFVYKLIGMERNDRPGLLAFKLCPDFLSRIKKPPLVIAITGTNGKTTTSSLVNGMLTEMGYKTSFNSWGANLKPGYAVNLMRGVTIFNKSRCDVSVLEADEKILDESMPLIEPQYIIVTNISKDSLKRNAHPEYIFSRIDHAFHLLGDKTTAILNANDPRCCRLAMNSKRVFYGMAAIGENTPENAIKDITLCPACGEGHIEYNYKLYRHIGDFFCDSCSFAMPDAKYRTERIDYANREMTISEGEEQTTYPLISDTLFNAFNVLSCVALLREMKRDKQEIAKHLKSQVITDIRETSVQYNGIEVLNYSAKSLNAGAASSVLDHVAKDPCDKVVILMMDDIYDDDHPLETLTWIYESDHEFLNRPNIKQVIVGGHMYRFYKLRLLLAGIDRNKLFFVENRYDTVNHIKFDGIKKVYVLFDIDFVRPAQEIRDMIVAKAKEELGK